MKFFTPEVLYEIKNLKIYQNIKEYLPYLLMIIGIVFFQLFEVNVIDPPLTEWIQTDFAITLQQIEGDFVFWFSQHWMPVIVYFFVFMYIVVYPFTLWFSLSYFLLTGKKKSIKAIAYGLLLIYVVVLPFYLFLPVTNVYTYYNVDSSLEAVIPTIEQFFYSTTTKNNCLPSLHTAMTILVAWSFYLTKNKRLTYFAYFSMISVIISVIYLAIHWVTDVLFGAILAIITILILRHFIKDE
ncbi:MAG: phosphatase PAP2 family protein [Thermoplasmatales archaeon]|nr:MAG: phosphatase PAP2 family protein [Thermoplasmatales archaeon]